MSTPLSALVLGATGGIGSALARRLQVGGWRVALAGRRQDALDALTEQLQSPGFTVDATSPDSVDALFARVLEAFGRIDAVAHCVGSLILKPAHLTSDAEWGATLATNLTSAFCIVRAAGRHLSAAGGSVVLVSSVAAQRGLANHEAIAAAKAGVEGLVRSAAATYARQKLRFNAVAPGLVRTPLSAPILSHEASLRYSTGLHALGRLGEPDDIAGAIAWLLSPEQGWITGQVIPVDGGLSHVQARAG